MHNPSVYIFSPFVFSNPRKSSALKYKLTWKAFFCLVSKFTINVSERRFQGKHMFADIIRIVFFLAFLQFLDTFYVAMFLSFLFFSVFFSVFKVSLFFLVNCCIYCVESLRAQTGNKILKRKRKRSWLITTNYQN